MMMGPDPMMRTRWMSLRRGISLWHNAALAAIGFDRVGQVGNLRRIGNPPGLCRKMLRADCQSAAGYQPAPHESDQPRSFTAKILHKLHEVIEQVMRIVGPRRGLRMILDAEHRLATVPESFQRLIVQVDVRQVHFTMVERIGIHREAVIVRGDLHLLRHLIQHGMIRAAVPELQLVSFAAHRETKNLMTKANAEDGFFTNEISNLSSLILQRLRITRTI